jgi:hypothetical protein
MAGVCGQYITYCTAKFVLGTNAGGRRGKEGRDGRGIITEPILGIGRIKR